MLVVCRVGMRSHYAAQFLASQGFTQVSNLNGGMDVSARPVLTEDRSANRGRAA